MITGKVMKDGATYLATHLKKNDYWFEGEEERQGEWVGKVSDRLELETLDFDKAFESLRTNENPHTGEQLTPRQKTSRRSLIDVQLSAPKDVSVLAVVGGDDRVEKAFRDSVRTTLGEMERWAAVREREGKASTEDRSRITGEFVAALFHHDASRALDPQLHTHAVFSNITYDRKREGFYALQEREMLIGTPYFRQVLYNDLSNRLHELSYETHSHHASGFEIKGIEHLRDRFSRRTQEVNVEIQEFRNQHKRMPTKKEIDVIVRQTRDDKLAEISTPDVRRLQLAELTPEEQEKLRQLVESAKGPLPHRFKSDPSLAIQSGLDHVFERKSVVRDTEALAAAYELTDGALDHEALRAALHRHADLIHDSDSSECTLHSIREEELNAISHAKAQEDQWFRLGDSSSLSDQLADDQRQAAKHLLDSSDGVMVLIGDAGTGKTFVLKELQTAHIDDGGQNFMAFAPTGKAKDGLKESGFPDATTVQRLLVDEKLQSETRGRVLLVDEAGMLSTRQLAKLAAIAAKFQARLLLVGDAKQHEAVSRGNALRSIVDGAEIPVARMSKVRRQVTRADKRFSEALARKEFLKAFRIAEKAGRVVNESDQELLMAMAADKYVDEIANGKTPLVVIPTWKEINQFNDLARETLKERGLLERDGIDRLSFATLSWTDAKKTAWHLYKPGMLLNFHGKTKDFSAGDTVKVIETKDNGVVVENAQGKKFTITRRQQQAFDVGEAKSIEVAVGDRLLFRANHRASGKNNGETAVVTAISEASGEVTLDNGKIVEAAFSNISHGHAVTSHKSQGSSVDSSILVMGHGSSIIADPQQWYVSNTRFKTDHTIFLANRSQLERSLEKNDSRRELAREFLNRFQPALASARFAEKLQSLPSKVGRKFSQVLSSLRPSTELNRRRMHQITTALKSFSRFKSS